MHVVKIRQYGNLALLSLDICPARILTHWEACMECFGIHSSRTYLKVPQEFVW